MAGRTMIKGNREMITLSLSPDTKARLKAYAAQNHRSISQAITDWVWTLPLQEDADTEKNTEVGKE